MACTCSAEQRFYFTSAARAKCKVQYKVQSNKIKGPNIGFGHSPVGELCQSPRRMASSANNVTPFSRRPGAPAAEGRQRPSAFYLLRANPHVQGAPQYFGALPAQLSLGDSVVESSSASLDARRGVFVFRSAQDCERLRPVLAHDFDLVRRRRQRRRAGLQQSRHGGEVVLDVRCRPPLPAEAPYAGTTASHRGPGTCTHRGRSPSVHALDNARHAVPGAALSLEPPWRPTRFLHVIMVDAGALARIAVMGRMSMLLVSHVAVRSPWTCELEAAPLLQLGRTGGHDDEVAWSLAARAISGAFGPDEDDAGLWA